MFRIQRKRSAVHPHKHPRMHAPKARTYAPMHPFTHAHTHAQILDHGPLFPQHRRCSHCVQGMLPRLCTCTHIPAWYRASKRWPKPYCKAPQPHLKARPCKALCHRLMPKPCNKAVCQSPVPCQSLAASPYAKALHHCLMPKALCLGLIPKPYIIAVCQSLMPSPSAKALCHQIFLAESCEEMELTALEDEREKR